MITIKKKDPNKVEPELDVFDQYFLEVAKKELAKAAICCTDGAYRRSKAQELLRESLLFYTKLPTEFTDEEYVLEYNKLYSKVYRGY